MNPVIRYSALFLLLLFVRVMTPDAILLNMHHHAHTEHTDDAGKKQVKVEKEHQHCPVDRLFDIPFQGTQQPTITIPVKHASHHEAVVYSNWQADVPDLKYLRGPPVV